MRLRKLLRRKPRQKLTADEKEIATLKILQTTERLPSSAPVIEALCRLYGFTVEQAERYMVVTDRCCREESSAILCTENVMVHKRTAQMDYLVDFITGGEVFLRSYLDMPEVARVKKAGTTDDDLEKVLDGTYRRNFLEHLWPRRKTPIAIDEEQRMVLRRATVTLPTVICKQLIDHLGVLRDFCQSLKPVRTRSPQAFNACLDDFANEIAYYAPSKGIRWTTSFMVSDDVSVIGNRLHPQKYLKLSDAKTLDALSLIPLNFTPPHVRLNLLSNATYYAQSVNADTAHITQLVRAAPEDKRLEILEDLSSSPTILQTYAAIKRGGATASDFINFLEHGSKARMGDTALLEVVHQLSENPSLTNNVRFTVQKGIDLIGYRDHDALSLLGEYPEAHLVLDDVRDALLSNDAVRAERLMMVGLQKPNVQELKTLRSKIAMLRSEQLATLQSYDSLSNFSERNVREPQRSSHAPKRSIHTWYDVLLSASPDKEQTTAAYHALPANLRRRLRDTWYNHPECYDQFCKDTLAHGNNPAYQLLLKDADLFESYLRSDGRRKKLELVLHAENPLVVMQNIFARQEEKPFEHEVTEIEVQKGSPRYKRVLVFGGSYLPQERDRLTSILPVPVEVCDNFELRKRRSIDMVRPGDLAIYVTSFTSHPDFDRVTVACKKANATLLSTKHENTGILKREIDKHLYSS
jgi:hypothetical protein